MYPDEREFDRLMSERPRHRERYSRLHLSERTDMCVMWPVVITEHGTRHFYLVKHLKPDEWNYLDSAAAAPLDRLRRSREALVAEQVRSSAARSPAETSIGRLPHGRKDLDILYESVCHDGLLELLVQWGEPDQRRLALHLLAAFSEEMMLEAFDFRRLIDELEVEKGRQATELQAQRERNETLVTQINRAESENQDLMEKVIRIEEEQNRFKREHEVLKVKHVGLEEELKVERAEHLKLKKECSTMKDRQVGLERELEQAREVQNRLEKENAELRQVADLRRDTMRIHQESSKQLAQLRALSNAVEVWPDRRRQYIDQHEDVISDRRSIPDAHASASPQLSTVDVRNPDDYGDPHDNDQHLDQSESSSPPGPVQDREASPLSLGTYGWIQIEALSGTIGLMRKWLDGMPFDQNNVMSSTLQEWRAAWYEQYRLITSAEKAIQVLLDIQERGVIVKDEDKMDEGTGGQERAAYGPDHTAATGDRWPSVSVDRQSRDPTIERHRSVSRVHVNGDSDSRHQGSDDERERLQLSSKRARRW